jgi:hypothetical protein
VLPAPIIWRQKTTIFILAAVRTRNVTMKIAVFWDVALCSLVGTDRRFRVFTLIMEAVSSSVTFANMYQTQWCYTSEDSHLHNIPCFDELLKQLFYKLILISHLPSKGKWGLWDHQSVCLSVRLSVSSLITLNQLVHFYEIQYGGHAINGNLDAVRFNPVPSTIPKWRTYKRLRWMQNLHQLTWDIEILYTDRSSKN